MPKDFEADFYNLKALAEEHGFPVKIVPWPILGEWAAMNDAAAEENDVKRCKAWKHIEVGDCSEMKGKGWRRMFENLKHELGERFKMRYQHWHYPAAHRWAEKIQYRKFNPAWLR